MAQVLSTPKLLPVSGQCKTFFRDLGYLELGGTMRAKVLKWLIYAGFVIDPKWIQCSVILH